MVVVKGGNESNKLENSSKLNSIINSLNLVHELNELYIYIYIKSIHEPNTSNYTLLKFDSFI